MRLPTPPRYYGAELYSAVLLGMARGIKAGDPAVKVLPGSLESLQDYAQAINSSHLEYAPPPLACPVVHVRVDGARVRG